MQERYLALTGEKKNTEVIVVEGKDDTANLRRFYEVDTYETRGSAIDQDDLERIATLQELRGVIVFTDPDYNGERIARSLCKRCPRPNIFFKSWWSSPQIQDQGAFSWVEHASFEDLEKP